MVAPFILGDAMKCIVTEMCWPDGDTVWKPGQEVDVSAAQYALLSDFLKPAVKKRVVEKVVGEVAAYGAARKKDVKDGSEK